jgi:hypothetical protein
MKSNKYTFVPLESYPTIQREQNIKLTKIVKDYVRHKNLKILQDDKISILDKMLIIDKMNKKGTIKPLNLFSGLRNEITEYHYF